MLQKGNEKLGKEIWTWSLPAVKTCPGATPACKSHCYAKRGHFARPTVRKAYQRNLRMLYTKSFAARIIEQIQTKRIRYVRIHASGDFDSDSAVRAWQFIAKACPQSVFYAYTRSWDDPEIYPELVKLARLPNVYLWWSCDKDMSAPPKSRRARRAYMATSDHDLPRYRVDLVFRTTRKSVQKFSDGGKLVCPAENGVTETTCDRCQLCFSEKVIPNKEELYALQTEAH